jgi:hypothetical protein
MIYLSIKRDPTNRDYSDLALTPIDDEEIATRELFRNEAAQAYVRQEWRLRAAQYGPARWLASNYENHHYLNPRARESLEQT